jgi:uncharacterized protein (DUF342 family)
VLLVAEGRFPAVGRNAEMEFYFQALAELGNTNVYYSSRRVRVGDPLCRKTPATVGETEGMNVMGLALPPRAGLDISLKTETGASLSLDGTEVASAADGVVVISRSVKRLKTVTGLREFPESITFKVNPVLQVQGDSVLDIATSQTIEIIGTVQAGSRILTDCEVYVSGDVEDGTLIEAGDDVIVSGNVRGATLNSQSNVIAGRDVSDSYIVAREQIIIEGRARNSSLSADSVAAGAVSGSNLLARRGVTLKSIEADENNILSTICVGMSDFFSQRIRDNEEFLEKARANLLRIEMLVGREIMDEITSNNLQTMLLKHLARHRMGQDAQSRKQAEVYRKLLESVIPTRTLVRKKSQENDDLKRRISAESGAAGSVVVVREKMEARTLVSVDGVEAEVEPLSCPAEIRADGDARLSIQSGSCP